MNRKAIGTLIWILFCKAFLFIPLEAPIQKQKRALSRVFQSHFLCSTDYSVALAMQNLLFSEIMIFSLLLFYTGHSLLWEYFSQHVHLPKFCYSRSQFKCHFSESFTDFSPIDLLPPGCRYSSHTWHHPAVWCPVPHSHLHCTAFAPRKKFRIKSRCCYSEHSHSILFRVDGQIMIAEKREQIKAKEGKQEGKFSTLKRAWGEGGKQEKEGGWNRAQKNSFSWCHCA